MAFSIKLSFIGLKASVKSRALERTILGFKIVGLLQERAFKKDILSYFK